MIKRITAFFLLTIIVNSFLVNSYTYAESLDRNNYTYENYIIETDIISIWQNKYIGKIVIQNIGDSIIDNWALSFFANDIIYDFNGAEIVRNDVNFYVIRNSRYNQDIYCGSSIEITFTAGYTDNPSDLKQVKLLENEYVAVGLDDYSIDVRMINSWDGGKQSEIIIHNNSDCELEEWIIKVSNFSSLDNIWGGILVNNNAKGTAIKNAGYNQNIEVGESARVGVISADWDIDNCVFELYTFKPIIEDIDHTTSHNTIDTISNNSFADNNECYFKNIVSENEIIINSAGIECVKNQLIIILRDYTNDELQCILDKYDISVVGKVSIADTIQIETKKDLNSQELSCLLNDVSNERIVEYVGYNYVSSPTQEFVSNDTEIINNAQIAWHLDAVQFQEALVEAKIVPGLNSNAGEISTEHMNITRMGAIDGWFHEEYEDYSSILVNSWENYKKEGVSAPPKNLESKLYKQGEIVDEIKENINHGSAVLELMGGKFNNNNGSTGTGIKSTLFTYSVSNKTSNLTGKTLSIELMVALAKMIGNDVKIINYSLGYPSYEYGDKVNGIKENKLSAYTVNIENFLCKLFNNGYDFLIVTSAGNQRGAYMDKSVDAKLNNEFTYSNNTAIENRVICVGATNKSQFDNSNSISAISAIGDRIDIFAPGYNVYSYSYLDERYIPFFGTSFSAPIVAGAASFALSVNPYLDSVTLKEIITKKENMTMLDESNGMLNMQAVIKEAVLLKQNAEVLSGIVRGTLLYENADVPAETDDELNKNNIINRTTQIEIYDTKNGEAELVRKTVADADGSFKLQLGEGAYILRIKRQGYIDKDIDVDVYRGSERILGTITLEKDKIKKYKYELFIHDFITDTVIKNVNINVREGWNNHAGEKKIASTVNSNNVTISTDGKITLRIEKGYYTVEIFCDGYISEFQNIYVEDNIENITVYLIPVSNEGGYAFILRRKKDDEIYMRVDAHSVCRSDDRLYGKDEGFYDSREPSLFYFRDDVFRISKQASVTSRSIGDELIEVFNIHDQGTLLYDFHVYKGINTAGDYSATVICDGEILKSYNSVSSRHLYICDIWGDIYNEINKDNAQTYYDCTGTLWWKYNMAFYRADWYYGEKDLLPDQL